MQDQTDQEQQDKAIPFIVYTDSGNFELSQEAEQFLQNLANDPIAVISIVGKYRTGKSFFVNRVLLDQQQGKGFKVGPTINPCTKGIWLWSKIVENEQNGQKYKSLILDTEGFGASTDADKNKDNRIFLIALLLSSFLIYNSQGTINEMALTDISLLINLAKSVTLKNNSLLNNEDVSEIFPKLLWVIRDFALQMTDEQGNPMTQQQYLESALELKKGLSDKIEEKNRTRKLIKHCFKDRQCVCFVRPADREQDLQNLDSIPNYQLRQKFVEQMKKTKQIIKDSATVKMVNSGKTMVTGSILIDLAKTYINVINRGECPNIESTWTSVCQSQNFQIQSQSMQYASQLIDQLEKQNPKLEELDKEKSSIETKTIQYFSEKCFKVDNANFEQYKKEIKKEIGDKFKILELKCSSQIEEQIEKMKLYLINSNLTDFYEFTTEMQLQFPESMQSSFQTFNQLFKVFQTNYEQQHSLKLQKSEKLLEMQKDENQKLKQEIQDLQLQLVQKPIQEQEQQQQQQLLSEKKPSSPTSNSKQIKHLKGFPTEQSNIKQQELSHIFNDTNLQNNQVQDIYEQARKEFQSELDKVLESNKNIQQALNKLEQRNELLEKENEDLKSQKEIQLKQEQEQEKQEEPEKIENISNINKQFDHEIPDLHNFDSNNSNNNNNIINNNSSTNFMHLRQSSHSPNTFGLQQNSQFKQAHKYNKSMNLQSFNFGNNNNNVSDLLCSLEIVSLDVSNKKQVQIRSVLNENYYTVWRTIKEFADLYKSIQNLFPKTIINQEVKEFLSIPLQQLITIEMTQEISTIMFGFMKSLCQDFLIRNSNRFKSFLGIIQPQQNQSQNQSNKKNKLAQEKENTIIIEKPHTKSNSLVPEISQNILNNIQNMPIPKTNQNNINNNQKFFNNTLQLSNNFQQQNNNISNQQSNRSLLSKNSSLQSLKFTLSNTNLLKNIDQIQEQENSQFLKNKSQHQQSQLNFSGLQNNNSQNFQQTSYNNSNIQYQQQQQQQISRSNSINTIPNKYLQNFSNNSNNTNNMIRNSSNFQKQSQKSIQNLINNPRQFSNQQLFEKQQQQINQQQY